MTANPFFSENIPVNKDKFIGRTDEIENPEFINIKNHIFQEDHPPKNLAIVGIPRVGKNSLVSNAIVNWTDDLYFKKKVLTIPINCSLYENSTQFFSSLVHRCAEKMEGRGCNNTEVKNAAAKVSQDEEANDRYNINSISDFFTQVEKTKHHSLFIVSKFDHAPKIFDNEQDFYRLRDLAGRPEISFVLIARRCIDVIESEAKSSSPFHQLFESSLRLAMFSPDDLESYFQKFHTVGITISENDREKIIHYCGSHPNLLQLLGYHIANSPASKKVFNVDEIFKNKLRRYVDNYYEQLCEFLEAVKLIEPLYQILSGNIIDRDDRLELEDYGLIQKDANGSYTAYSEDFHNYLCERYEEFTKSVDFDHRDSNPSTRSPVDPESSNSNHPDKKNNITDEELKLTWSKTEPALREIITTVMSNQYGDNWINSLVEKYDFFSEIIEGCRGRMKGFEDRSSGNKKLPESALFGYTFTDDLFRIILDDSLWNDFFQEIFSQDTNYWQIQADFIKPIGRTHVEHNNMTPLDRGQRFSFVGSCEEILRIHNEVKLKFERENIPLAIDTGDQDKKGLDQGEGESEVPDQDGVSASLSAITPPTPMPEQRHQGTVNWINDNGSYARIQPSTCESTHPEGIYVHSSDYPDPNNVASLLLNQEVEFTVIIGARNYQQAKNVVLI